VKRRSVFSLIVAAALSLGLTACGGSNSGNNSQPMSVVFVSQIPAMLAVKSSVAIAASVNNDNSNSGVKWSASCSSAQCGSFSPTSAPSGSSVTYSAPNSIPSGNNVTITATSVADSTKSASTTITITPPAAISVSFNPHPPSALAISQSASLTAVVSNDNANAGVTWTLSCGSAQCGNLNPTTTPSGSPTSYVAPSAIPSGSTVTVKATSVSDTTKSASATITIAAAPPPTLADGTYVFHLSGEDVNNGGSPYYAAGAFTVQNGSITEGEQDFVDSVDGTNDTLVPSGCRLNTTQDGHIQIVLDTADPNVGVNGIETIHGTKVSSSRFLLSEFDTFAAASGSLDLQSGTATPTGGYAFSVSGLDGSGNGLVIGGILNLSGTTLVVGNSVLDYNDNGSVGQGQSFASGSVTAPDSFGRVIITLTPSASSGAPEFELGGYIVGPNRIELVEGASDSLNGVLGGPALGQGSNTMNFTQTGVAGSTYVFSAVGEDVNGIATYAGGFALNSDGSLGGNLTIADLAVGAGFNFQSGNWSVEPNGRVTISNVTPSFQGQNPFAFQLYLDGNGNALELGVDSSQGTAGLAYRQSSGAVNSGTYAFSGLGFSTINNRLPIWSAAGPVNLDSALNWTGMVDYSLLGSPTPGVGLAGTTNASAGSFTLQGLDVTQPGTGEIYGFYPIDGSRTIAIQTDQLQLGTILIESSRQ
jgi:hypothetical protein